MVMLVLSRWLAGRTRTGQRIRSGRWPVAPWHPMGYSRTTALTRFLGASTLTPRWVATKYASNCSGMTSSIGSRNSSTAGTADGVAAELCSLFIPFDMDGEDLRALGMHVAHEGEGSLVAQRGVGIVAVAGGQHDERSFRADERVGTVLELAGRQAFRLDVGGLLELECAFAGDGVVDGAPEIEEGPRVAQASGDGLDLGFPAREIRSRSGAADAPTARSERRRSGRSCVRRDARGTA